ncbi:glycosyltransferase [Marivirga tractuosa]|uniref:glycosyltransferase n=1 Tax=Marivirga tractuosa TaxID=1006 RepID=UPI0035D114B9
MVNKLSLADQVEFEGLLTRNQLLSFYQSLDAYIHASEGETICYSIMEAQACGLPILASDVEGINNVISEYTGGLLYKNSAKDMATKISTLLDSEEQFYGYKKQSREAAVTNFTNFNNAALLYSKLS